MTTTPPFAQRIDDRILVSALWATTMIAVVFVDLFSLYRADVRAQIESGSIYVFDISPGFLLGVIIYVLIPTLMIPLTLALPRRANRVINIIVGSLFLITVIGGAVGEWSYYVLASAIEVVLLLAIVRIALRWKPETVAHRHDTTSTA
jgi:hypothetical protein